MHYVYRTSIYNQFKTDKSQLKCKNICCRYGTFYVDYLKVGVKSVRQFIGVIFILTNLDSIKFFPCSNETSAETGHTLMEFVEFFGLPPTLHSYNHKNFKEGIFKWLLWKFGIIPTYMEPHLIWQNRAKPLIGEAKQYARKLMLESNIPICLRCFCYEYTSGIVSFCATGQFEL